jgi:putative transcriptional regulator
MSRIKDIRTRLGMTQTAFAAMLGCTQGNIGHYERGQTLPPERAVTLIQFAQRRGLRLTMDQVYGRQPLPRAGKKKAVA